MINYHMKVQELDGLVDTRKGYRLEIGVVVVRLPARTIDFPLLQNVHTAWQAHTASPKLVSSLKIIGAIPPFSHTPSRFSHRQH